MCYGGDTWTLSWDLLVKFEGLAAAIPTSIIGSLSLQPTGSARYFIALPQWDNGGSRTWKASMVWYTPGGGQVIEDVTSPGFANLAPDTWYRWAVDFDLKTNAITEMRLWKIPASGPLGTPAVHKILAGAGARYLHGGTNPTRPNPTGFRLFMNAGVGNVPGNTIAADNVSFTLRTGGTKATATVYGGNPTGSMVVTGIPIIDTTMTLGLHNPLATQSRGSTTLLAVGAKKLSPGIRIPGWGMAGSGATGEFLIDSVLVIVPGPAWTGSAANYPIPVPADCSIFNANLFAQGAILDATSVRAPIGLTNAVDLVVGNVK